MNGAARVQIPIDNKPITESQEAGLVEQARSGDQQAFEQLYRMHSGRIYGLCWRLSGNHRALAEELTQEAFLRAWNKLGTFKGNSRFGTWLHRVAVNVALADRRIRMRQISKERSMNEQEMANTEGISRDQSLVMDLERAIAKLPERARTVLVLHDVEGYRHKDVADFTGMASGTSKAQLHRARKLLRAELSHD